MDEADWTTKLKVLKIESFNSPEVPGSGALKMHQGFVEILDTIFALLNLDYFQITSGYRTEEHNRKAGGSPTSSHLLGLAADISIVDSTTRFRFIETCLTMGIKRIGLGKNFIHIDIDKAKAQGVIWLYG